MLEAPVGPAAREAVDDLTRVRLARAALIGRQVRERALVGLTPPQPLGHALLGDGAQASGDARLAEVLLRQDVGRDLTPAVGHEDVLIQEDDRAVRVTDLALPSLKRELLVGGRHTPRVTALNLHGLHPTCRTEAMLTCTSVNLHFIGLTDVTRHALTPWEEGTTRRPNGWQSFFCADHKMWWHTSCRPLHEGLGTVLARRRLAGSGPGFSRKWRSTTARRGPPRGPSKGPCGR